MSVVRDVVVLGPKVFDSAKTGQEVEIPQFIDLDPDPEMGYVPTNAPMKRPKMKYGCVYRVIETRVKRGGGEYAQWLDAEYVQELNLRELLGIQASEGAPVRLAR